MASSRESSPGASTSPMELTPNSKIRAAMAAAGISESDEESVSGIARKRIASQKPKSDIFNANSQPTALGGTKGSIDVGSRSSSDEEEIARPRGRMAARMQAALDGSDDDQLVANNPRERVRRLMKNKPRPESPKVADDESHADESDIPVVSRRRKMGSSPRQTPVKSTPRQESASPGLFVTPSAGRSATPQADASDSDSLQMDSISKSNKTFQDLVARKRQERHAKEAEDRKKKAAKAEERKRQTALIEDDNQVDSEDEGGQRLTQQNRPTRKASKRAIEEMHRETQRLSRNMQLAHKATNKKKITKQSLFAKFGYRQTEETNTVSSDPARPTSSSPPPAPQSDIEMQETPPTSPPDDVDTNDKREPTGPSLVTSTAMDVVGEEDLPTLEEALRSSPPSRRDKGKGKAVDTELIEALSEKKPVFKQRPIQVRPAKVSTGDLELDSDSDLEIVEPKKSARNAKLDAIFKRIPEKQAKEPHSMVALRMLAHLRSPGKQNSGRNQKPSITAQDLQISLQLKARQQAHREREERLQALRDRGIIVQTAEEREKEMAEVDDLLAKARREGEEIQAREKAAAKRERKANGEVDSLGDSSDDEDWQETNDIPEEEEVSGSEDNEHEDSENDESGEDEDEEVEEEEATDHPVPNPLFDNEAEEDEESEIDLSIPDNPVNLMDAEDEEETLPVHRRSRKSRVTNIISDDEEEEDLLTKTPKPPRTLSLSQPRTDSPVIPTSVLRSATKTFIPGLPITGPAGLGLTQIFQGTMDDSQDVFESSNSESQILDVKEHSMDFLRRRAMPELPDFVPTMIDEETQDMVMDSQTQIPASQPVDNEAQGIQVSFSQSQIHDFDSLVENPLSTQVSEFPNTQDEGFSMITPIKSRFMDPPSTAGTFKMGSQSTQMIGDNIQETPIAKRKGKLRRRARAFSVSDEDESLHVDRENNNQNDDFEITADAFDVMRKAAKRRPKVEEFDKKKSNAKNMVNEQAEESEDEYAGLGGASDDESGGEEDAFVKEMIDDEKKDIDESELAKFYADRERASDEKQIEKLYNDISKGMLRRKRGADYDLSDSDDGGEARQRRKRAAEAKMRKALLADEKIGKIAQNPKKEAFLRAIEDRGSDDEMGFLDDFQEKDDTSDSQSQTQNDESQQPAPSQTGVVMGPPSKRKHSDSTGYVRPPPHLRRTGKKPSNLSEVRESLSSLIEDPHAMVTSTNFESDSDDDLEIEGGPEQGTQKNRDPFAIRRTGTSIIDRIQLKRESSSNVAANNERLAFAAPSSQPGHRVVPLLRKATTNSSILSGTSSTGVSIGMSATERMAGGKDEGSGIRRGGGKHSGVNSFVRESERKAVMEKKEKRREQRKFKGVESRRKAVGGLFGKGTFE